MSEVKQDPVKLHKDGNNYYESGKYAEAKDAFIEASNLYQKVNNFFDATFMLYKAGESEYMRKNFDSALIYFLKSADLSFDKGYDRFGLSALEYARDCYKATNNKSKLQEIEEKIKETKKKLEEAF